MSRLSAMNGGESLAVPLATVAVGIGVVGVLLLGVVIGGSMWVARKRARVGIGRSAAGE